MTMPICSTRFWKPTATMSGAALVAIAAIGLISASAGAQQPAGNQRPVPPDPTKVPQGTSTDRTTGVIPAERLYAGWSAHPLGASDCTAAVPDNTIQMYKNTDFGDSMQAIGSVTTMSPGGAHEIEGPMEDSMSSLRWNLPPGVVVVFYEDDGGKGEQLPIWGKGEMNSLHHLNFNDKASSWAWYYAGGAARASNEYEHATIVYPNGVMVLAVRRCRWSM
jgi:hypothetical protein